MSIARMEAATAALEAYFKAPAIVLVANPVYGQMEHRAAVALFDTIEQARTYEVAARRRAPCTPEGDRYFQHYRGDSLLHNFNPGDGILSHRADAAPWPDPSVMFSPALPCVDYQGLPRNPPPLGPEP